MRILQRFDVIIDLHRHHPGFFRDIAPIINTTPNSPTVWAKPRIAAVINPGRARGKTTVKKVSHGFARKVAATSSGLGPMAVNAFCNGCTTKGME